MNSHDEITWPIYRHIQDADAHQILRVLNVTIPNTKGISDEQRIELVRAANARLAQIKAAQNGRPEALLTALPAEKFIVRYGGSAVKFVHNVSGKHVLKVADEDATPFDSESDALKKIGSFHISGRAFVDTIKAERLLQCA